MDILYGEFNYNSSKQIAVKFDSIGVKCPLTEKGNPSLNKDNMAKLNYMPMIQDILEIRGLDKALNTFLINSIHGNNIAGRVHCSFYPTSTETGILCLVRE